MKFKFDYSKKIGRLKQTLITSARLISLLWSIDKWLITANAIAVSISALVPFAFAFVFKLLIDQAVFIARGNPPNFNMVTTLFLVAFAIYLIQSLIFSAQDYFGRLLYTKVPIALFQKVLSKISSLDMEYFENSEFKNTLEKVRDSYEYRPLNMMDNLLFTFQSIVQIITSIIVLASLSPFLILVVFILAVPELISKIKQSELSWGIWDAQAEIRKRFWYVSTLLQERDSIKEMRLFELPGRFLTELKNIQENIYKENKTLATKYLGINALFNLLSGVTFIAVLFFIIWQALYKKITVGDISYYTTVITNLQNGIGGFFRNIVKLFSESLYVSSIFEVLDAQPKIIQPEKPVHLKLNKAPRIEFKNINFKYPGSKHQVFKDFSLTINPGEKIALVGENGAGKTTLVKLLARFYDLDSGEILIEGINLKDLDLTSWYKYLGILFQDFVRYEYKVKENIHFGKIWEQEVADEIVAAAKQSGADPMIQKLEKGYEQMLGRTFEGGVELSAGQWQRIALARGFLKDAQVLILDEPTSSIDAKAEAEIFGKVEKLSKDKSVIIISHRFSTVRNADKIFVIDNGQIIESGSHQELMKINAQYANLFNLQAKGYQ